MKLMLTKTGSGESRVVDVINVTDVPYCFWMWARYREKWKHDWHHDPTNRRGANESKKEKYARYNKMKRADLKDLTVEELEEYKHFKERDGKWTTTRRVRYKDAISIEGIEMYRRMLKIWKTFLKNETNRTLMNEMWDQCELEQRRLDRLVTSGQQRRRRKRSDDDGLGDSSPTGVVHLRDDDGYESESDDEVDDGNLGLTAAV